MNPKLSSCEKPQMNRYSEFHSFKETRQKTQPFEDAVYVFLALIPGVFPWYIRSFQLGTSIVLVPKPRFLIPEEITRFIRTLKPPDRSS